MYFVTACQMMLKLEFFPRVLSKIVERKKKQTDKSKNPVSCHHFVRDVSFFFRELLTLVFTSDASIRALISP